MLKATNIFSDQNDWELSLSVINIFGTRLCYKNNFCKTLLRLFDIFLVFINCILEQKKDESCALLISFLDNSIRKMYKNDLQNLDKDFCRNMSF